MASFRAHLSPHEQTTLRRIAAGTSNPHDVREPDARRLIALGLVAETDGLLAATPRGTARNDAETLAPAKPPGLRRLQHRTLPF